MQILLGCAKIMTGQYHGDMQDCTEPVFQSNAEQNALQLMRYSVDELQHMLNVNTEIALENRRRYFSFLERNTRIPAVFAYDGMVFKKLAPESMTEQQLCYAQEHLNICSFLYGLLRPLDLVNPYRLEGSVELPDNDGMTMFRYWQPLLTDYLIDKTKTDDGILVNLASDEMRNLFDWKRIRKELRIITPQFKVEKNGKLKTIVIYTKMCRGAMSRDILVNRITVPESLASFTYDGFTLHADFSDSPLYILHN